MLSLGALLFARAGATEVTLRAETNVPARLELPWPYDESALREPRGYNHHGAQGRRIVRQISVENTGSRAWAGGEIVVDGREELPAAPRELYTAWTLARSHAASGLAEAQDPWRMLRFWGYTLCGEDTRGLSALLAERKVPGRSVPLNGHVAGEYNFDNRWSVIDGDQNIVYLNLDNRTLAGYAEIRADPFLALRTKPFGRFARPSLAASQFNAGLFEYIDPPKQKPLKIKESDARPAPYPTTLHPGERLIYHYDQSPATQAGDPTAPEWRVAAPAALGLLELQASPKARDWHAGPLEVQTTYPILAALNLETGERAAVSTAGLVFQCAVPVAQETDRISVWMQRAQVSLPRFHRGANTLTVAAERRGDVSVQLLYDAENLPPQPSPPGVIGEPLYRDVAPSFALSAEEGCERDWWQIAGEPAFGFIAPNLEQIEKAAPRVALDLLTNTFLNDRTDYFFRVKTVRGGVWSDWSAPMKFRVEKPLAPSDFTAKAGAGGEVHLEWKGPGDEFAIFASNRLDFLPEVYANEQIVSMRGQQVLSKRSNDNRFAVVKDHTAEVKPPGRYLRVLARRGAAWSNPSALLTLPPALCTALPASVVFQIRWTSTNNTDTYVGAERPLPP